MNFQTIGVSELWDMIRRPDVYVVDLREPDEYRKFHVDRAHNYPYDDMSRWMNCLPKTRKIVLYCDFGSTSMLAARRLKRLGYDVYTLVGGIHALNG